MYKITQKIKSIGERIKKERLALGYSQEKLAEKLGKNSQSRKIISNWERGIKIPSFDDMIKMCDLFNCEIGYLICEYDDKSRERIDIKKVIGLSEEAIKILKKVNSSEHKYILDILSGIIENDKSKKLLMSIHSYVDNKKHKRNFYDHDNFMDAISEYESSLPRNYTDIYNFILNISELEDELAKKWNCDRELVPEYIKSLELNYINDTFKEICKDLIYSDENTDSHNDCFFNDI